VRIVLYNPNNGVTRNFMPHDKPLGFRVNILVSRLCFRGIYFPMMGRFAWVKVVAQNRRTIFKLVKEAFGACYRPQLRIPDNCDGGPEVIPELNRGESRQRNKQEPFSVGRGSRFSN